MPEAYRLALPPPQGELCVITRELVQTALSYSRSSPRRRMIQPFHKHDADPLHRMLNAMQPDSYVRPHRHLDPPKAEAWVLLRGRVAFFTFEGDGRVRDCLRLDPEGDALGVDLGPGVYHSLVALSPDTVLYEVKTGPYAPASDKSFAPWAPAEGTPEAAGYLSELRAELTRRGLDG